MTEVKRVVSAIDSARETVQAVAENRHVVIDSFVGICLVNSLYWWIFRQ
jgi:hypothetical protein